MIRATLRFLLPAAAFAAAAAFVVPALFPSAPSGEAMVVAKPAPAALQSVEFSGDDCKALGRHTLVLLLEHGETLTIPLPANIALPCEAAPETPGTI